MPHVHIQHFPREFTEQERTNLAAAITTVILENFKTTEGAVSITLEPVAKAAWAERVVAPQLTEREHLLLKTPEYRRS